MGTLENYSFSFTVQLPVLLSFYFKRTRWDGEEAGRDWELWLNINLGFNSSETVLAAIGYL